MRPNTLASDFNRYQFEAAQFGSVSACRLLLDHGLKTRKAMAPDRERNSPSISTLWKDGLTDGWLCVVVGCFVLEIRNYVEDMENILAEGISIRH